MRIEILADPEAVTKKAAEIIAAQARNAVAKCGSFTLAVSGGHTPWIMLRELASQEIPWFGVHVFQVDERIAPKGDPDRNLTHLQESLLRNAPLSTANLHAMPVESADLAEAAREYASTLRKFAGNPAILDLVHLGMGPDGHTASLVPHDPVLNVETEEVAVTDVYMARRRMTVTFPLLNRARRILWLVTGADKALACQRLFLGDKTIPAGRVHRKNATLLADEEAAREILRS